MPSFNESQKGFHIYVNPTTICQELFVLTLNVYMQPNTFCFNFKPLSKNRYSKGMCCLHLAAKKTLIDWPYCEEGNFSFRETVYSWILWNMARYYYRNILQTSAAYLTKVYTKMAKVCLYLLYVYFYFTNTQFLQCI